MIALYIILGILLLILLLLSIPLKADIVYNGSWTVKIKYLFLSFQIAPQKEKSEKAKVKKEKKKSKKQQKPKTTAEEKQKKSKLSFVKEKGLFGILHLLKDIVALINASSRGFLRHLQIYRLDLDVAAGGGDAAEAAMNYGYACSAIYPAVSFVESHLKRCKYRLNITADFDSEKTNAAAHVILGIRPMFAIHTIVKTLVGAVRIYNFIII